MSGFLASHVCDPHSPRRILTLLDGSTTKQLWSLAADASLPSSKYHCCSSTSEQDADDMPCEAVLRHRPSWAFRRLPLLIIWKRCFASPVQSATVYCSDFWLYS